MKVVSLFSGAGGMDLGFVQAGHQVIWANEIWTDAAETYRRNLGGHIVEGSIENIKSRDIPPADIVVGGFPCQGFSVANTSRSDGDKRNLLYLHFQRVVGDKQPLFFLAENVKGILSLGEGRVFERIVADFSSVGYNVRHTMLNAADYGVPQRRERVFLLGIRKDVPIKLSFPPNPSHARSGQGGIFPLKKWVGVGKALEGIPEPDQPHTLNNHECSKYKLRFNGYLGHRRVDPDLPAPTITARGDDLGGVVILHHPSNKRRLTARETAIIQSFPVDYYFHGTKTSIYRQVANAVPPMLAYAIAKNLPKHPSQPTLKEAASLRA